MTPSPRILDLANASRVLMISDLHLSPEFPQLADLFEQFLSRHILSNRRPPEVLLILGDLFDYWIGDDAADDLGHTDHLQSLRAVSDAGVQIFFIHGNRDFLVGEAFEAATGATILDPLTCIDLPTKRIIVCHGDELCTDDVEHQQFRIMVRDPSWQSDFLKQSLTERQAYAQRARATSETSKSSKTMEIMDVSDGTVDALMKAANVDLLIHGHTHRPALHLDNRAAGRTRVVLGDWKTSASFIDISDGVLTLESGSERAGGTILLQA